MSNDFCPFFPIMPIASCVYVCTHTECFDSPGSFSSPGYPNEYWNFVFMSWLITAPPGKVITINFNYFNTQPDWDYIEIYDGASISSESQIGKHSGNTEPGNVTSSSNNLLVTFITGSAIQRDGFSATFAFKCKHIFVNS